MKNKEKITTAYIQGALTQVLDTSNSVGYYTPEEEANTAFMLGVYKEKVKYLEDRIESLLKVIKGE